MISFTFIQTCCVYRKDLVSEKSPYFATAFLRKRYRNQCRIILMAGNVDHDVPVRTKEKP